MGEKYLNVMLLPDGKKGIRFKLSLRLAYLLAGFFVAFLLVAAFLIASYSRVYQRAFEANSLALENRRLSEYNAKVTELENQVKAYRDFIQRISELAGVELSKGKELVPDSKKDLNLLKEKSLDSKDFYQPDVSVGQFVNSYFDPFIDDFIPRDYPVEGWITKSFIIDKERLGVSHPGVDIACREGSEVKATAYGWVRFAGWDPVYGNLVILKHSEGYATLYGHNQRILIKEGEFVKRKKVIALSGNTGRSSAPHLHYEIRKDGTPKDPQNFLVGEGKNE